jgi:predicted ATP-grasp superfamily ATP-dependent carboligase
MLLRRRLRATSAHSFVAAGSAGRTERRQAPANERLDVAVLDADERQSLVCVRSLGRAGLRVGTFGVARWSPSFGSRWSAVAGRLPDCAVDPDAYVDAVLRLVDVHRPHVLITAHDGTIQVLRSRRALFDERTSLALAPESSLDVAVDKARTLELARTLGILVPNSVVVERIGDVASAVREVGLPAVVKPTRSWLDGAGERLTASVAVDVDEASAACERAIAGGGAAAIQELVTGSREAVSLFVADGTVTARFAQVAHRMYPLLGGSSVVRESIPLRTDLVESADALALQSGLQGYAEVEFRRDIEGRPRLMEINPRLSASVEVAVRSGVDFPRLLYDWATTGTTGVVRGYTSGVRMRWLGGDVRWLRDTLASQGRPEALPARRAVADFVLDSFRPAAYDYVAFSDPRPVMRAVAGFAVRAVEQRGGLHASETPP